MNVNDTVDANVFIDASQPTHVSKVYGKLNTCNRVADAHVKNLSSPRVRGSGSLTVDFMRTAGRPLCSDDVGVEEFRIPGQIGRKRATAGLSSAAALARR